MAKQVDFEAICRTCLGTEHLNPIFLNPDNSVRYSIAIFMIAGLKVEMNDGLPQNMCIHCINSLNKAIEYRKQCKAAETWLLQIKSQTLVDPESEHVDIEEVITTENDTVEPLLTVKVEDEEMESIIVKEELVDFLEPSDTYEDDIPLNLLVEMPTDEVETPTAEVETPTDEVEMPTDEVESEPPTTKRKYRRNKRYESLYQISTVKGTKKRVRCNVCHKELSIRSIDRHIESAHPDLAGIKVKCKYCDSHITEGRMNWHLKMIHGVIQNPKCRYCDAEFQDQAALTEHIESCTYKNKRKPYNRGREMTECDVCHQKMQRASLRMHKDIKHNGLGPVCEHCGKKFGNLIRLSEHLRAKHGYEKFKCESCDYETASDVALQNHERRHRGEKPFVCETCGASFHAPYLLIQHKISHRTVRAYQCTMCTSSFKSNNALLVHKKSRHSTVTYPCPMCSRRFRWRRYAMKHARLVHNYTGPPSWGKTGPADSGQKD